jgi:hypothetical protein
MPLNWDERFMTITGSFAKYLFQMFESENDDDDEVSTFREMTPDQVMICGQTVAGIAQVVVTEQTPQMARGHSEEEHTALHYIEDRRLREGDDIRVRHGRFYRHPVYPWLGATTDRSIVFLDGKKRLYETGLECKFWAGERKTQPVVLHRTQSSTPWSTGEICKSHGEGCRCRPPQEYRDQLHLTMQCTRWTMIDLAVRSEVGMDYIRVRPEEQWQKAFHPRHVYLARHFFFWYWSDTRTERAMENFVTLLSKTQQREMDESTPVPNGILRFLSEMTDRVKVPPPSNELIQQTRTYIVEHHLDWLDEIDPENELDWNPRHRRKRPFVDEIALNSTQSEDVVVVSNGSGGKRVRLSDPMK